MHTVSIEGECSVCVVTVYRVACTCTCTCVHCMYMCYVHVVIIVYCVHKSGS